MGFCGLSTNLGARVFTVLGGGTVYVWAVLWIFLSIAE